MSLKISYLFGGQLKY